MVKKHSNIELILSEFESVIRDDFLVYKNHCHRILNYMLLMGLSEEEEYKCSILIPFHDLAIWTDNAMNYLPSSIALTQKYIAKKGIKIEGKLVIDFIGNHHKITKAKGSLEEPI